jgi:hypothetical protein
MLRTHGFALGAAHVNDAHAVIEHDLINGVNQTDKQTNDV